MKSSESRRRRCCLFSGSPSCQGQRWHFGIWNCNNNMKFQNRSLKFYGDPQDRRTGRLRDFQHWITEEQGARRCCISTWWKKIISVFRSLNRTLKVSAVHARIYKLAVGTYRTYPSLIIEARSFLRGLYYKSSFAVVRIAWSRSCRRHRGSIRCSRDGTSYLPTTTRQHLGSVRIRRSSGNVEAEHEAAVASSSKHTDVGAPMSDGVARARARARSSPTSNWIPSEAL